MVNLNSLFSTLLNTQLCPLPQTNSDKHHEKLLLLADLCFLFAVLALWRSTISSTWFCFLNISYFILIYSIDVKDLSFVVRLGFKFQFSHFLSWTNLASKYIVSLSSFRNTLGTWHVNSEKATVICKVICLVKAALNLPL